MFILNDVLIYFKCVDGTQMQSIKHFIIVMEENVNFTNLDNINTKNLIKYGQNNRKRGVKSRRH